MKQATETLFPIAATLLLGGCGIIHDGLRQAPETTQVTNQETNTAAICFNPALTRDGTQYQLRFRRIIPGMDPSRFGSAEVDFHVDGVDAIDGTEVTITDSSGSVDTGDENPVVVSQRIYSAFDLERPATRRFRIVSERTTDGSETRTMMTQTFSPPRLFRYDLRPGESYTQEYRQETVRSVDGGEESEEMAEIRATTTFTGFEQVRGASGPVTACRFEEERRYADDQPTTHHTYWIGIESGLTHEERIEADGNVQRTNRLIRATINDRKM